MQLRMCTTTISTTVSLADLLDFFNRNFCPDAITDSQNNNIREIIPLIINIYLTAKYRKFKYY